MNAISTKTMERVAKMAKASASKPLSEKARQRAAQEVARYKSKKPLAGSKNQAMESDDFPSGKKPAQRKLPIHKSPFKR